MSADFAAVKMGALVSGPKLASACNNGAVDGLHDIEQVDIFGCVCEKVSALGSADGIDESCFRYLLEDFCEVALRDAEFAGDLADIEWRAVAVVGEINKAVYRGDRGFRDIHDNWRMPYLRYLPTYLK